MATPGKGELCSASSSRRASASGVSRFIRVGTIRRSGRVRVHALRSYTTIASIIGSRHGRSAASRQTLIEVEERCRETITRVLKGTAVVVDRRNGRRHRVRAGQRHRARASGKG
jgi:hypothetical protein